MVRSQYLRHLYNPYEKPQLWFFIQNNKSRDSNEDLVGFNDGYWIEDFNLYGQPNRNPLISFLLVLPIQLVLTVLAIFIQARTCKMLKCEKGVNDMMMNSQAKIHILFWPFWTISIQLINIVYPLSALTSPLLCHFIRFFFYFGLISFSIYSFYAALLRYLICNQTDKIETFGKEKLIRYIHKLFYIHVTVWTLSTILTSFNLDHAPLINSCSGHYTDQFLMESSSISNMMKRHFSALENNDGKTTNLQYFYTVSLNRSIRD